MTARGGPLPLALTSGDPAGIGPDITLLAWLRRSPASAPFYLLADPGALAARARHLGLAVPIAETDPAGAAGLFGRALPVVPLGLPVRGRPGAPSAADAAATIASIETAVAHVRAGLAGALVTNPIAKSVLYEAGFAHPGHTEFLGALTRRHWPGEPADAVMMIWSAGLAVVPVTIHVPLRAVPALLSADLIARTARIVARDLRRRFGIAAPRLACAGLNPHAGEDGTLGREEIEVIVPALDTLRAEGLDITGPWPADALFTADMREGLDAVLVMYHDQGLVPIKALAFDEAVNVTLGLPFVRTSPDHGTAFTIAGSGAARPDSLIAALRLAARLAAAPLLAAA